MVNDEMVMVSEFVHQLKQYFDQEQEKLIEND
jgi:hypothetical protein